MICSKDRMMPVKKRKWMSLEFSHNIQFPVGHEGTGPLIIKESVGKTLIHRLYVDNGCSVNILYKHCLDELPPEVRAFVKLATLSVLGFTGQVVWPEGKYPSLLH